MLYLFGQKLALKYTYSIKNCPKLKKMSVRYTDVCICRPPSLPPKPKKRRLGQGSKVPEARLFGGSIEEYVEATGEEIPLIVRSCIRVISMFGKSDFYLFNKKQNGPLCMTQIFTSVSYMSGPKILVKKSF